MKIISYTDTTTGGADPTQVETWQCKTDKGRPFTVTQFFGEYLIQWSGEAKKPCPEWVVAKCQRHASAKHAADHCAGYGEAVPCPTCKGWDPCECAAEAAMEARAAECAAGWDPNP